MSANRYNCGGEGTELTKIQTIHGLTYFPHYYSLIAAEICNLPSRKLSKYEGIRSEIP